MKLYKGVLHGITGEEVKVLGALTLPCQVAGKAVEHQLVVADIVEPVLLGLDFLRTIQATWDWNTGDLVYQEGSDVTQKNLCRLVQAEVLFQSSTCYFRVAVSGTVTKGDLVHVQACKTRHIGGRGCD